MAFSLRRLDSTVANPLFRSLRESAFRLGLLRTSFLHSLTIFSLFRVCTTVTQAKAPAYRQAGATTCFVVYAMRYALCPLRFSGKIPVDRFSPFLSVSNGIDGPSWPSHQIATCEYSFEASLPCPWIDSNRPAFIRVQPS
jgi:hypothetical protein